MATVASPPASFIDPKDVTSSSPSQGEEDQSTVQDASTTLSQTDASAPSKSSAAPQKKKRKSWGQVLPEPTTNLPPRKRAKTTEEKAQRHYERVQRNRQAAHNSRMRKQDEMDRVVAENNRLKQDNQHQSEEIRRLQEELSHLRGYQGSVTRPLTPPMDLTSKFSQEATPAPSLTNGSSNDVSSPPDLTDLAMPSSPHTLDKSPMDAKQFNDSHSAEMCTQQWTLNSQGFDINTILPQVATTTVEPPTDKVQFDDLLNLDGLDNSDLALNAPGSNIWTLPATGFECYNDGTDFNLFPPEQLGYTNPCY